MLCTRNTGMHIVWSRDNCGWCDKAKELLDSYGFEYEVKDVYEHAEEFMEQFPDAKTVPQIIFNGKHVGGYNGLHNAFEEQDIFRGGGRIGRV